MTTNHLDSLLSMSPVIPVMVIEEVEHAVPLAQALFDGGLQVLEITLRSDVALQAIEAIKAAIPQARVGAGTVLDASGFQSAKLAGADFYVSPGMTSALQSIADPNQFLPGVATASEAMDLMEKGFNNLKLFPAGAIGGMALLKSLHGPLPKLRFCPTGGLKLESAKNYLKLDNVVCVGGSWMVSKPLIQAQNWPAIQQLAQTTVNYLRK